MSARLVGAVVVLSALVAAACADDPGERGAAPEERTRPTVAVGEPYPYSEPAPPEEPTPLDGLFTRTITIRRAGGPPIYCQRCAPWRLDAGAAELQFDRGRFFAAFEPIRVEIDCRSATLGRECKHPPGFEVSGHFRTDGDRLELFNDPNCIGMTGTYRWSIEAGSLVLEEVADRCPFVRLRAKYLTAEPWRQSV